MQGTENSEQKQFNCFILIKTPTIIINCDLLLLCQNLFIIVKLKKKTHVFMRMSLIFTGKLNKATWIIFFCLKFHFPL